MRFIKSALIAIIVWAVTSFLLLLFYAFALPTGKITNFEGFTLIIVPVVCAVLAAKNKSEIVEKSPSKIKKLFTDLGVSWRGNYKEYYDTNPSSDCEYDVEENYEGLSAEDLNSLAIRLTIDAEIAAKKANKSRTIKAFIEQYDIILSCFQTLSRLDGKVTSVHGNLFSEYCRLSNEFQKHLHDSIDRSGEQIIEDSKGLYKHDPAHTKESILNFKSDIDIYSSRFDAANFEFANAKFRFVCHECSMPELIDPTVLTVEKKIKPTSTLTQAEIDIILQDEENWRREQRGLSSVEYELQKIDKMDGHAFEHWCADILKKSDFSAVEVTQGSNDQGVDVLAEKDGIKYAIQCKCYTSDLGNTPIQEVNTGKSIYHCHVGVVMTNRHFTAGAKKAAEATGVLLWDREKLIEILNNL